MTCALKRKLISRIVLLGGIFLPAFFVFQMVWMPGKSWAGKLPPLSFGERRIQSGLKEHVEALAGRIGERNIKTPGSLDKSAEYIASAFRSYGYHVRSQWFEVNGERVRNLEVELPGDFHPRDVIVVGAHYDSVDNCPGANDNASGIAGMLELARIFAHSKPECTLRFAAFVNEEDPYFATDDMGSVRYAKLCRERADRVKAMISIETIGYHTDTEGSQKFPPGFGLGYPHTGNFIWFVGNESSRDLVRHAIAVFRKNAEFPAYGAAAPEWIDGIDWSDQYYFWKLGNPGFMVTDSAPYRYPHYHKASDTPDQINYSACARIVDGLKTIITDLAVLKKPESQLARRL